MSTQPITYDHAQQLVNERWSPGTLPPGDYYLVDSYAECEAMDVDDYYAFLSAAGDDVFMAYREPARLQQMDMFDVSAE